VTFVRGAAVTTVILLAAGPAAAQAPPAMTLQEAEQTALKNHPQIQAAQYTSAAATELVREARSAYFPTAVLSFTGAQAQNGSRIAAGGLNNPVIYDRFASGVNIGQLLTDFGRTHALVQSSALTAEAQAQNVFNERAATLLDVDDAYFGVLRAEAVHRVAEDTVAARQLVVDQVTALAASNLKSGLDVSFARVNLATAQLLLVQARNDVDRAYATFAAAVGSPKPQPVTLVEPALPGAPPIDGAALVASALRDRPDVAAARFSEEAAARFATAERDLFLPSVTAVAAFGMTPYHQVGIQDRYSAIGVNVNVPVMNGSLFAARHAEAASRAQAASERVRDLENRVARDVNVAWLNARTAFDRLDLTNQLLDQASQALELAQSRYDLGLSSIVELSQAQLNKTQAELEQASARYDYLTQTAALQFQTGARK
jgi:outer membrane protein